MSIYAELTADHQHIVLVAGGDPALIAPQAKQLHTLTPLFSKTEPEGGLLTGLSWSTLVQLSAMFPGDLVQGPALRAWVANEAARRTSPTAAIYVPPEPLTPYTWQREGAAMIAATGRTLITDEPGCIAGDAEIAVNRNGKGFRIRLRDLVARLNGTGTYPGRPWDLNVPTYVQREVDGVVRLGRILNAWSSGAKQTYTVTTETGRTIRATDEHPFLTRDGWQRLDELRHGTYVHVRGGRSTTGRQSKQRYREVAGLPAHPYCRGAGRRTSRHRVAYHRLVAEADRNRMSVEAFIARIRTGDITGLRFINPALYAVHHRDFNPTNNARTNLQGLTHREHHQLHAHEGKADHVALQIDQECVVSVEPYGVEETYDLEVADDPHNFIANGFVVHNTGKTITAILGLVERHRPDDVVVVVCPASVIDAWVAAWKAWAPHLDVVAWRGSGRRKTAGGASVYVTSYDTARIDTPTAESRKARPLWDLLDAARAGGGATHLVVDECHLIKNHRAARSEAVIRLANLVAKSGPRSSVVCLSGTPITHHPGDLYPTLQALDPAAFPSRERWVRRYCIVLEGDERDEILGLTKEREPEFRLSLLGQQRRVAKADVLTELPPKVYSVRTVELPPKWRKAYDEFEETMRAELDNGDVLSTFSVMAVMTHLSALASAPADVRRTYGPEIVEATGLPAEHVHLDLKAPSWKVAALIELLEERRDDDGHTEPTVCFAVSRQLIMLAGAAAEKAGLRVGYIVGEQSAKTRSGYIKAFQAGELDLICVTTSAGGVGITLTAASTVVFLQRPWSLVDSTQAEDRCHRIGSERHESIQIIDVVAKDTLDARVRAVLRERAEQLADLVQDRRIVTSLLGGRSTDALDNNASTHAPQPALV